MDETEFQTRFTYHEPTEAKKLKHKLLRDGAQSFAAEIEMYCPESREKSLAFTALEEAVFWANAAIARRS